MSEFFSLEQIMEAIKSSGPPPKFNPHTYYCPDSDTLHIYWKEDPSYSEFVTNLVSISKSFQDDSVTGVTVFCAKKGVCVPEAPPVTQDDAVGKHLNGES